MKNSESPASPIIDDKISTNEIEIFHGLTKREMMAMHIMANTCWNNTDRNQPQHYEYAASSAVKLTDALLKELEK